MSYMTKIWLINSINEEVLGISAHDCGDCVKKLLAMSPQNLTPSNVVHAVN